MKRIYSILILCCALVACKKNEVNFTFSPTQPRAGETVYFTNQSSSGEDWEWSFGDGGVSVLRSPSYVYTKPGTYRVVLKVDNKKSLTCTQELTVYDTIPTFVASDSVFYIYGDYTFTANVYNPYNYAVEYDWTLPDDMVQVVDSSTAGKVSLYFTQPEEEAVIGLRVIMNGDTTDIEKSFYIEDLATNSVLFRTPDSDYRQRIYGPRAEDYQADASEDAKWLLDMEDDTEQWYNDSLFTLANLSATFPGIKGFKIASRKIYYRTEGLYVANIDGAYRVQIDAECQAMTLDKTDNRIYWANSQGVWFMPFVGSDNNKFVSQPVQLNTLPNVTKIAADAEER